MAAVQAISLDDLARRLQSNADALARLDLSKEMKIILLLAKSSIQENFVRGAAPDGTPWLPLKRPRQGKRHKGSSPLPLRDTGMLLASLTANGSHHVENITGGSMEVGTNLEYAAIQNFGGVIQQPERTRSKPWVFTNEVGQTIFTRRIKAHTVTIPARPFLGWNDSLLEQVAGVLGDAVSKELPP